ncbi:MAG: PqqD family protein [Candidatus Schekmanbacteria bacterium]|nr:PqqD family protein [Candidatus Schekmanbacteria bacterium]
MELGEKSRIKRRSDIVFGAIESDIVMTDLDAGMYYSLNETGARLWSMIAEPLTLGEVCDALAEEYGVDRSRCLQEVVRFAEELRRRSLLEVES